MWDKFYEAGPPLGPFKGTHFQRGPNGGVQPMDFISFQFQVRPVDFIFWSFGLWMLFCQSYLRLGTSLIFGCQPFNLGPTYTFAILWLERKKQQPLMKTPAKLASNCSKGGWNLFCWALLPCLSNSPLPISSPRNLIVIELSGQDMSRYWIWPEQKKAAESSASSVPG